MIVLQRYWVDIDIGKVVIVFFQHQRSSKVSVVLDTFWRYFCEASCHDWSSNLSLECTYLRVLVFIRTCMYVYLRDVLEWFSLMRTPNIPTKHRIRGVNCQPKKPTDYPLSFDEKKSLSNCHKLSQTISTGLRRKYVEIWTTR